MKTNIYALVDPRNGEVKYVGKTVFPVRERLGRHIREARQGVVSHKCNWIRQLLNQGLKPLVLLLEETEDWQTREVFWIAHYQSIGKLTNLAEGGKGSSGYRLTAEQREKQVAAMRGKKRDVHFSQNQSERLKGRRLSEETKAKISATKRGKSQDSESNAKRSAALKGKAKSEETKAKISAALKGKKPSEQCIEQSVMTHTGRKASEATRQKMSEARKGLVYSEERNRKISDALKKSWAERKRLRDELQSNSNSGFDKSSG